MDVDQSDLRAIEHALSWPSRILYVLLALLMLVWLVGVDAAPHIPGPIQPWDLEEVSR